MRLFKRAFTGVVEIRFARVTGFFVFPSFSVLRFALTTFSQSIIRLVPGETMRYFCAIC